MKHFSPLSLANAFGSKCMRDCTSPILVTLLLCLFAAQSGIAATTQTRISSFAYDATTGLLTKEIIEPGTAALCLVTQYAYDGFGNKATATIRNCNGTTGEAVAPTGDPVIASRTATNTYDLRGQFAVTSSNAIGQSESKTFDPKTGALLSLIGPNGLKTSWQYDGFGRKTLETRADGTKTQWSYDYCNGINGGAATCPSVGGAPAVWVAQTKPLASDGVTQNGPASKTYYDGLNRELRSETEGFDGGGASTAIYKDTQYDSLGRPYKVSRPYYAGQTAYWATVTYDSLGRVIQEVQPDNTSSSTVYNGLVTTQTNAGNQQKVTTRNGKGQVVNVADALNSKTTYTYDPFGNLLTTTDPLGNVVALTYDARGRKIQMKDPDMGTWSYAYNAIGQLVRQTDAKSQVTTMAYDLLGRMTSRSETDLISNWYYDTYKGGAACNKGIGKLCQSETSTGYSKVATYDNLGRDVSSATTIDVPSPYSASATYDSNGRLATRGYPTGLVVKYVYTTLGYLKEVRDNSSNALFWQANSLDAEGHLLQQTYGNGAATQQSYNAANGQITGIVSGAGNGVQNLAYQYDALGNVTSRSDANQNLAETFLYDALNRLTSYTVNSSGAGIVTTAMAYDSLGNITSKGDLGTYTYPVNGATSLHPHAVSQVVLTAGGKISFIYDANGALSTQTQVDAANNAVAARSRAQFHTSFGMPQSMGQGTISAAFYYGPEHQRVKQISSVQGSTIYVNPGNEGALFYEKDIRPDNSIEQRNFITAGGQTVAIVKYTTVGGTTTTSVRYLHRDNLGSVAAVTDESGAVIERLAFDPFGKRRFANGTSDPNNTILPQTTDRGFTDHEMLDELALIHMNGRIYDPLVGRFMSADPLIQSPDNLQSYNRYAYVLNNPMMYTDPSGYSWWTNFRDRILKPVVAIVAAIYLGPQGAGAFFTEQTIAATIGNSAIAGFVSGAIQSGTLQGGVQGAFSSILFAGAGQVADQFSWSVGESSFGRAMFHAGAGCIGAATSGGDCGKGALSAGFTQYVGAKTPSFDSAVANTVKWSVIGGTASVLGGGKFANGAQTGAFQYLFNEAVHQKCVGSSSVMCQGGPSRADRDAAVARGDALESSCPECFAGAGVRTAVSGARLAFSGGGSSVFWSGYSQGALDTAMTLGMPLEGTLGGRALQWITHDVGIKVPDSVWNWASSTFANNASGAATAVIRAEGRVWSTIEKPILMQRGVPINYVP